MRPEIRSSVALSLLRRLAAGDWSADVPPPAGRQLARTLHVSPPVLLAAWRELAGHGLVRIIERRPVTILPGAAERAATMLTERQRVAPVRVAILIPESEVGPIPFHQAVMEQFCREAAQHGIETEQVVVALRDQVPLADSLISRRFGAAIGLSFVPTCAPLLVRLKEKRFPIVLFNRNVRWLDLPSVVAGEYQAVEQIGDRLVNLGHRNLCLVSHFTPTDSVTGRNWVSNWLDYLRDRGLLATSPRPVLILPWHPALQESPHSLAGLFDAPDRPTAIIFSAALWACHYLADPRFAPLRVPGDVSLAVLTPGQPVFCPRTGIELTHADIDHPRAAQCLLDIVRQMLAGHLDQAAVRIPMDVHFTDSIGPVLR